MDVIFNAEALRPPITGVGNYSFHLLEQLLQAPDIDRIHCFTGTDWRAGNDQLEATKAVKAQDGTRTPSAKENLIAGARYAIGNIPGTKALYDAIMDGRFERTANNLPGALYHETNYILKPFSGPAITTVHDLSHVRYPQFHPEHVVRRLDRLLPPTLDRADLVITVSDVVREEVIAHYNMAPQKVRTVYEGVDARYVPRARADTAPLLSEFGLHHQKYVLLVATLEPRKGIGVLLDAWEMLPMAMRQEYPLVLTGSSGWRNEDLRDRIAALAAQGTVRHLGYVKSEVLPLLYSGAAVFSYPSVYEGFGLPVLDAMSSGVPVICRAGTSMAEFSEGACLLCQSDEAEELAVKLAELLESAELREQWSQQGLAQAAQFSWERCARETAELYRELL